jgi:hypothetical protein
MRRVARWADGWAMPNVEPGSDAATQLAELRAKLLHACELEGRDPATVRIVTGAPIDASPEHLALLADAGVDDVDLMLTKPEHLDMQFAAEIRQTVLGAFE